MMEKRLFFLIFFLILSLFQTGMGFEEGDISILKSLWNKGLLQGADSAIIKVDNPTGYEISELLKTLMINMANMAPKDLMQLISSREIKQIKELIQFYNTELSFNMSISPEILGDYSKKLDEYAFLIEEGGSQIKAHHLPVLKSPIPRKYEKPKEKISPSSNLIELPSGDLMNKNGLVAEGQYFSMGVRISDISAKGTRSTWGLRYGLTRNIELGVRDHRYSLELANKSIKDYVREGDIRYGIDLAGGKKLTFGFTSFTSTNDYLETVHRWHSSVHIPFNQRSADDRITLTALSEDYYDDKKDGFRIWGGVQLQIAKGDDPVYMIGELLCKGNNQYNLYNIGIRTAKNPSIDLIYHGDSNAAVDTYGARLWYQF